MAKTCWIEKSKKEPKFKSRKVRRCWKTGRRRAYMRRYGVSRLTFREMALSGEIPGVTKASW